MAKYTITFTQDKEQIDNLKAKERYPFLCGGIEWVEKTVHNCDDLTPFYGDPVYVKNHFGITGDCIEGVDPRLIVEINQTKEEQKNGKKASDSIGTDSLHTS
jgi:hypothetical protein